MRTLIPFYILSANPISWTTWSFSYLHPLRAAPPAARSPEKHDARSAFLRASLWDLRRTRGR